MDEKLQSILDGLPFKLSDQQIAAIVAYINGEGHFYLSGEAGSGKSLIIQVLKQYYGDEMVLCASTGVANQNLLNGKGGDGTAARVWSIPFYLGNNLIKVNSPCSNLFSGSDLIKHVIIDEFPMLNSEALNVILMRIKRFNKKTAKRGARQIRVLAVGDNLQIPTVVREDNGDMDYLLSTYGSEKIYRCKQWEEFNPTIMVLTKVFRQKDKVFRAALDVLRYGEEHRYEGVLKWLNKRVNYRYDKSQFTVAVYKATVDRVNNLVLQSNPNDRMVYTAIIKDKFNLQENNVEKEVVMCKGLEVITTINDEYGEYFNGTFCTIDQCTTDGCWVIVKNTGKKVFVPLHEYEETESYVEKDVPQQDGTIRDVLKRRTMGTCTQLPIVQSSAITCHRAQGATFSQAGILDLGVNGFLSNPTNFGCALTYVGLSRWTDINLITLPRPIKREHIKVDRDAINFWNECLEKSII